MSPPPANSARPARTAPTRGYATLVVALAAFLAAMVVLRVPFRGYLVEARLSGRLDEGLHAGDIQRWLETAAAGVHVRVLDEPSGRCEVVLQQLTPRASEARGAMDRVARQFAEQYVPARRDAARQVKLSRLQAELQTARDAEDAFRARVDDLRQQQLAAAPAPEEAAPPAELLPPRHEEVAIPATASNAKLRERLESLRVELSRLLASYTDEHPEVITLRSQIARLEGELLSPSGDGSSDRTADQQAGAARLTGRAIRVAGTVPLEAGELIAQADAAASDLTAAIRTRQWAERQLQSQVELLAGSTGMPWGVESARVLTRVGGTPRGLTLLGATLIALVAAGGMYWLSAALVPRVSIQTTDDLAALLALPLVGHAWVAGPPRAASRLRKIAPLAAQLGVRGAEVLVAGMLLALVFTMVSDRSLAGQVLGDPFGVLSEVAGRLL